MKKRFFPFLGTLLLSGCVFAQMNFFRNDLVGILLFVFSFSVLGKMWKVIYKSIFPDGEKRVFGPLSYFTPFFLVGLMAGIFLTWYKADALFLSIAFFLTGIFTLELFFRKKGSLEEDIFDIRKIEFSSLPPAGVLPVFYFLLWGLTLVGLLAPATIILQTPWQHVPVFFLILFFFLTLLLGKILFTSQRITLVLFLLVLHSALLHLALPLSHQLPWGGDVWRTIGIEEKFIEGKSLLPVLFGQDVKWKEIGPLSIPEAFVIPNKYVYSHLWGETVFLARLFPLDLITLNRFLVPVIWSLFVPILLYAMGRKIFSTEKQALCFSFLSFLPFSLQALGSLTLAVSWGFIFFLFLVFLWFEYIQTRKTSVRNLALFFGALSVFGYTVFFIVFWFMVGITFLLQWKKQRKIQNMWMTILSIGGIFLFPLIELILKIDHFPANAHLLSNIKQAVGQFSGWFYANAIRTHDIASGNIIFNHTPLIAFVQNIFTVQRWHILFLMVFLAISAAVALYSFIQEKNVIHKILFVLFFTVAGGYGIGWYFLEGERFFIRRLDGVLALLIMLLATQGIFFWIKKYIRPKQEKIYVFFALLFFSFSLCTVYASGPDMRVVSVDEYEVARYVQKQAPTCVLADTWVLLALEGVSKGEVVGGGFPIDERFGQTERVKLYTDLLKNPQKEHLSQIDEFSASPECFLVVAKKDVNLPKMREIFGDFLFQNTSMVVWKMGLKNSLK